MRGRSHPHLGKHPEPESTHRICCRGFCFDMLNFASLQRTPVVFLDIDRRNQKHDLSGVLFAKQALFRGKAVCLHLHDKQTH